MLALPNRGATSLRHPGIAGGDDGESIQRDRMLSRARKAPGSAALGVAKMGIVTCGARSSIS